jgi:hypothetical protein
MFCFTAKGAKESEMQVSIGDSVGKAPDAIFHVQDVEIEQEAKGMAAELEVSKQLPECIGRSDSTALISTTSVSPTS